MSNRDLHNNIKVVQLIDPIVGNNDSEGTPANGLDTRGFDSAELVAAFGVSGDTLSGSVKVDIVLQDSDDDAAYSAVTDANDVLVAADSGVSAPDANGIIASVDAAAKDEIKYRIGYRGTKRYCRLFLDFTGTHTNGVPIAEWGILGHPHERPSTD
jgi:hypothetical protein